MKSNTYHLHLETESQRAALFHLPESEWLAAAPRHKALAKKLKVTVGWDGDIRDEALKTADFLITNGAPPRDNLRARAPKLKWIQTTAAGVDWLTPLDWLPRDVVLTNNRGAHGPKAYDTVMMALLMLHQKMPALLKHQQAREWRPIYTPPIAGKTAVILGFGDLGEHSGRAAKALGMQVIAVTRQGKPNRHTDRMVKTAQLDRVLPKADYFIVTTPLTAETRGLISRARLNLLKTEASVINIGRSPIIDYEALREKLHNGKLAGAVLDVFDQEPLPADSPWWSTPNTIILPHQSCDDPRYIARLFDFWFANFARFLAGKKLMNMVDRKRGY
ncbi:MAG: D-2-hydroxyacid dehydrogenase [Betaproteobacteria bacterium]|nr:D-2-hydroxyacid dehydrogenase [Betaproteobacteria bacterium]